VSAELAHYNDKAHTPSLKTAMRFLSSDRNT